MSFIYIVTDCEFDGPLIGQHSMLSFGSVALSQRGESLGEFEAVLEPLPNATQDPVTMEFWHKHPDAWAAATLNPVTPSLAMHDFIAWIRSFDAKPIFAAHPVALDGPWLNYYLIRFVGRALFEGPWISDRLFKYAPLCIMSMVAGKTGSDFWECDVENYPDDWLGAIEHTHRAIDDARGYANLLSRMIMG